METSVRETSRRLRAAGDDVRVFASDLYDEGRWETRSNFRAEVDGVPVRRFRVRRKLVPGLTLPAMVGLMDALRETDPDIIHAHSHRYGHVLESAAVAERRDIPLVVSTHYHPADRGEPPRKRALLRLQDVGFGATAYRIARALVVETEFEARLVREFAPADRIRIIPPGIDLAAWDSPQTDPPTPGDLPREYFLFVGRVAPNKGLPTLLEAVARSSPPGAARSFSWDGTGANNPASRPGPAPSGSRGTCGSSATSPTSASTRAVMRGARALVLPSEYEAFGLVLLEAMVARTPVVATAVGGVPEVVEQGRLGRLVPYGDPDALAEALRAVSEDPEGTRSRVQAASERVRAFDWTVTTARLRALYGELRGT